MREPYHTILVNRPVGNRFCLAVFDEFAIHTLSDTIIVSCVSRIISRGLIICQTIS